MSQVDDVVQTVIANEERTKKCAAEIDAICMKYGCLINSEFVFNSMTGPRIVTRIVLNPKFAATPPLIVPPTLN